MNDAQRKVLELLAQHRLTAEEAGRMLDALEATPAEPRSAEGLLGRDTVFDEDDEDEDIDEVYGFRAEMPGAPNLAGIFDIDADFADEFAGLGFDKLTMDELIEMRIHDVEPDFVRDLRGIGFADLPVDELVAMKIHGVDADFAREMASFRFPDLTPARLAELKIHGIDSGFIEGMRAQGFNDFTAEQVIDLKLQGFGLGAA